MSRKLQTRIANALNQPDLFSLTTHAAASVQSSTVAHGPDPFTKKKLADVPRRIGEDGAGDKKSMRTQLAVDVRPVVEPRSKHLLDVRAAAAWLGLSKSTLDKMRCYGTGPRYIRATCRAVRYDPDDLRAYAEARGYSPGSEA